MTLKPIDTPSVGTPTAHSSSGLVQPMFHTASATSDTNGNITFTFGGVFTGQILIGSFSCPSAPYTAQFTAYNNSQEVYSWQSSNNPGPLRVSENQQITVSGTGLVPSTQYVMNWVGYSTVGGFAPQIVPASHTDVVISTNQGGLQIARAYSPYNTAVTLLPTPPTSYAYRIHAVHVFNAGTPTTAWNIYFYYNLPAGQGIAYVAYGTASELPGGSFLLNGLLVAAALIATNDNIPGGYEAIVNYDLIQI